MSDVRREEQLRIQAVGAAISRRDWHAVEQAYNAIRDEFDRRTLSSSSPVEAAAGVEAAGWLYDQEVGNIFKSRWKTEWIAHQPGEDRGIRNIRQVFTLSPAPAQAGSAGDSQMLASASVPREPSGDFAARQAAYAAYKDQRGQFWRDGVDLVIDAYLAALKPAETLRKPYDMIVKRLLNPQFGTETSERLLMGTAADTIRTLLDEVRALSSAPAGEERA